MKYDYDVWKIKALKKHHSRMYVNKYNDSLLKIINWCNKNNVLVDFKSNLESLYCQNAININMNISLENQVYILLHECGHYLISKSKTKRYQHGYQLAFVKNINVLLHNISVLDEELNAWWLGKKLANKLKINLTLKYDEYAATQVLTYIKCLKKKKKLST